MFYNVLATLNCAVNGEMFVKTNAEIKTVPLNIPQIKVNDNTADKIHMFVDCINEEEKLKRIYQFIKYIYFKS